MLLSRESSSRRFAEIDGLRAVAVVLVIFYHMGLVWFPGGFIGVDVFFVISGYLITRMILAEMRQGKGRFDFSRFYIRRIKRLLPALLLIVAAAFIVGLIVMRLGDFAQLSGSAAYSTLGLSNIFFWEQSGYFDPSARFKPLLHTWSLGVETQFYLLWPLLLVASFRWLREKGVLLALACAFVLSVALNLVFSFSVVESYLGVTKFLTGPLQKREATMFFMMPFRIFEFSMGAAVLWLERRRMRSEVIAEFSTVLGLAMILAAGVTFDAQLKYPSYYALLPCAGTALTIWAAKDARFAGALLRNPISFGIGQISYSLYLVHWPVIVFDRYVNGSSVSASKSFFLLIVILLLSCLVFFLVERPIHLVKVDGRFTGRRLVWASTVVACLIVAVPAAHAFFTGGWPGRYSPYVAQLLKYSLEQLQHHSGRGRGCVFQDFKDFDPDACVKPDPARINILFLGDSAADYAWSGLYDNLPKDKYNILQLTPSNCRPGLDWGQDAGSYCVESNRFIFPYLANNQIDLVILGAVGFDLKNLGRTLGFLKDHGRNVLVLGKPFIFSAALVDLIGQDAPRALRESEINAAARSELQPTVSDERRAIAKAAAEAGVGYYDLQAPLCTNVEDLSTCRFVVDGSLITADKHHLIPSVARVVLKPLAERILKGEIPGTSSRIRTAAQ